jgi:hypothetical protein
MAFNQIMRLRVSKVSRWVVNKNVLERQLTVEELREAVQYPEQHPLLNRIYRSANTIPGTR